MNEMEENIYVDKEEFIECLKWAGWELQDVGNPEWDLFLERGHSLDTKWPARSYKRGDIWACGKKQGYYFKFYKPTGKETTYNTYTYKELIKDTFFGKMLKHDQLILTNL